MAGLALAYVILLGYLHFQGGPDISKLFGGPAGMSVLNNADRIAAYRIEKPADRNKWSDEDLLNFAIVDGPISVSQSDAQALLATLQERKSFAWDAKKACMPTPEVRLDFIRGNDRLSVLLCFECDILENFLNGKLVGGQNFDNARPTLVRIARSIFPDDPKIQSLRDQH